MEPLSAEVPLPPLDVSPPNPHQTIFLLISVIPKNCNFSFLRTYFSWKKVIAAELET